MSPTNALREALERIAAGDDGMRCDELDAVVTEYQRQTLVCSSAHMMRRAPAYATLLEVGEAAIPALLRNLASPDGGGMAIMHALADITESWPEYETVTSEVAPGWVGFDVDHARQAWLRWGRERAADQEPTGGER